MKKISVLVATVIVAMGITSCGDSHKSASLKTAADSVSYAIGISTGAGYKENLKTLPGDPANVDDLIAGFIQAIKGDSSAMKMTPQAAQAYVQTYFMEASARDAKKTKEEGEKFLAENKTKKDVITTESGLQYQVVTEGKGAKPTAADSVSYAIGISTGAGYKENLKTLPGDPANVDDLIAGFIQAIKGDSSAMKMTPQAAQAYVQTYFMEASARDAKKTKEEGEKFLAENKTKKDVITTESGLQYQVVTEGKGAKPTADDKVKVHYTGTLLDGTKFDSTMDRGGEPAEFPVGGVIKGWTEVLQLMPVGSKYIVWVPSELAYGERGAGQDIKPNSTLKFEIELLDIVKDSTADKK